MGMWETMFLQISVYFICLIWILFQYDDVPQKYSDMQSIHRLEAYCRFG